MRTDHLGGTLADRLQSGPLGRDELAQLARDLLDMLAQLHAKGTVHRDLRPDTVRLDGEGRLHSSKIGTQRGAAPDAVPSSDDVSADLLACGQVLAAAAGPDASAPVMVLIGMLTADEPVLRPGSASEALALLGGAPVPRARTVDDTPTPPAPIPPAPTPPAPTPSAPTAAPVPAPAPPFPPVEAGAVAEAPPLFPLPAPAAQTQPIPVATELPPAPEDRYRRRPSAKVVLAVVGALLAVGVVVGAVVATTGGSDDPGTEIPPPAATSLDQQLSDLDGVIDTLGG
ncbi:hypothetical protein GCM10009547_45010 [Sporichthya brevicatena]|uniref:Protein kinase domain-containing protein n=1 Tax=Sporichthya brevicatena TaxID=171442 RepID=A0ABN1HAX1_9ACTN